MSHLDPMSNEFSKPRITKTINVISNPISSLLKNITLRENYLLSDQISKKMARVPQRKLNFEMNIYCSWIKWIDQTNINQAFNKQNYYLLIKTSVTCYVKNIINNSVFATIWFIKVDLMITITILYINILHLRKTMNPKPNENSTQLHIRIKNKGDKHLTQPTGPHHPITIAHENTREHRSQT
jgi:hypothetical protein